MRKYQPTQAMDNHNDGFLLQRRDQSTGRQWQLIAGSSREINYLQLLHFFVLFQGNVESTRLVMVGDMVLKVSPAPSVPLIDVMSLAQLT